MVVALVWAAFVVIIMGAFFGLPLYFRRHPEKRSPSGRKAAGMLGIGDELFHPDAYAARIELNERQRLVEQVLTPDGDKGITAGKVRIDL